MTTKNMIMLVLVVLATAGVVWFLTNESTKHTNMMREKQLFFPLDDSVPKAN